MSKAVADHLQIAVLLLAAGSSRRMGERNKLLLPVDGRAMLSKALTAATQSGAVSVHLVTGYDRARVMELSSSFEVVEVHNSQYMLGQDLSIALGMTELQGSNCSVLVLLADQPAINAKLLLDLMQAHKSDGATRPLVPVYRGSWGTPRILPSALVRQVAESGGGLSLRALLKSDQLDVQLLEVNDAAVLHDIDTPAEYRAYLEEQNLH